MTTKSPVLATLALCIAFTLACGGGGGGDMEGTYCNRSGECLTLKHTGGDQYDAAFTDRSGSGGYFTSPYKDCGNWGCDYKIGGRKVLTAYENDREGLIVTDANKTEADGEWKRQ